MREIKTRRLLTGTAVQNGIIDCARSLGYYAFHDPNSERTEPGYPDITIVGHGALLALEAKSRGECLRPATVAPRTGRLLPGQADWLEQFGAITTVVAGVVRDQPGDGEFSYDQVLAYLRDRRG